MRDERQRPQRPRIVAVDHDATTRALLADELDCRYGRHYHIVVAESANEALIAVDEGATKVALVLGRARNTARGSSRRHEPTTRTPNASC